MYSVNDVADAVQVKNIPSMNLSGVCTGGLLFAVVKRVLDNDTVVILLMTDSIKALFWRTIVLQWLMQDCGWSGVTLTRHYNPIYMY